MVSFNNLFQPEDWVNGQRDVKGLLGNKFLGGQDVRNAVQDYREIQTGKEDYKNKMLGYKGLDVSRNTPSQQPGESPEVYYRRLAEQVRPYNPTLADQYADKANEWELKYLQYGKPTQEMWGLLATALINVEPNDVQGYQNALSSLESRWPNIRAHAPKEWNQNTKITLLRRSPATAKTTELIGQEKTDATNKMTLGLITATGQNQSIGDAVEQKLLGGGIDPSKVMDFDTTKVQEVFNSIQTPDDLDKLGTAIAMQISDKGNLLYSVKDGKASLNYPWVGAVGADGSITINPKVASYFGGLQAKITEEIMAQKGTAQQLAGGAQSINQQQVNTETDKINSFNNDNSVMLARKLNTLNLNDITDLYQAARDLGLDFNSIVPNDISVRLGIKTIDAILSRLANKQIDNSELIKQLSSSKAATKQLVEKAKNANLAQANTIKKQTNDALKGLKSKKTVDILTTQKTPPPPKVEYVGSATGSKEATGRPKD